MHIILASASPRRAQILAEAGIAFEVLPTETDEARIPGETVAAMVLRLAQAKAEAASRLLCGRDHGAGSVARAAMILGADTSVEVDGDALGKPCTAEDARRTLSRLSGRTHRVLTGICAIRLPDGAPAGTRRCEVEITKVKFASLDPAEVDAYVATREPFDKAGGYAVQGAGGRFVESIEGCYFNVVGLPLARVYRILKEWEGYGG